MSEPFLAEIRIMSFSFAPKGWAMCNGQLLAHQPEPGAVLAVGHDLRWQRANHFRPARLARAHAGARGRGLTLGERAGEEDHTLLMSEMPTHTHVASGVTVNGNAPAPTNALLAGESTPMYAPPDRESRCSGRRERLPRRAARSRIGTCSPTWR